MIAVLQIVPFRCCKLSNLVHFYCRLHIHNFIIFVSNNGRFQKCSMYHHIHHWHYYLGLDTYFVSNNIKVESHCVLILGWLNSEISLDEIFTHTNDYYILVNKIVWNCVSLELIKIIIQRLLNLLQPVKTTPAEWTK